MAPVRGAYGRSGDMRTQDEVDRRVEQVAKANRKPKSDTSAANALKGMPEGASDTVASAQTTAKPELTDRIKIVVLRSQGVGRPTTQDRFAGDTWVDPEEPDDY